MARIGPRNSSSSTSGQEDDGQAVGGCATKTHNGVAYQPARLTQILSSPYWLKLTTTLLAGSCYTAKLSPHPRLGFLAVHTICNQPINTLLDVECEFGLDFFIQRRVIAGHPFPPWPRLHGSRSAGTSSTRPTARVWLRQRSISSSSAAAPDGLRS